MSFEDKNSDKNSIYSSLNHFAIGVDSRKDVDKIAEKIQKYDKQYIIGEARVSGLGDYLVTIKDIEENLIEIIWSRRFEEEHKDE